MIAFLWGPTSNKWSTKALTNVDNITLHIRDHGQDEATQQNSTRMAAKVSSLLKKWNDNTIFC